MLDRGPGLDPGEEEAVFERFHRGRRRGAAARGTGLGLAIARELARIWNGHLHVRARGGGGAVVAIELPPPEDRA